MRLGSLAKSAIGMGLFVATVVALRAADDKSKANQAVPPSPGIVKFTAAPAAVQKAFKEESKNSRIDVLGEASDGSHYRAIVGINNVNYQIAVSKEGQLLEKVLEPFRVEVKVEDVPAPVMKTLKEESRGGKVDGVVQVIEGKQSEFVIDLTILKQPYQLIICDDGTLLSKVMFTEEHDGAEPKQTAEKPGRTQK